MSQYRAAYTSSHLTKFARPHMQTKFKILPGPPLTDQWPTYFWGLFRGNRT